MSSCPTCEQKQKKIESLVADYAFEQKKMSEDLSNEKVTLELHFSKELKKCNEKYQKEKCLRETENRKWIEKYDSMIKLYEDKLTKEKENTLVEVQNVRSHYDAFKRELQQKIQQKYVNQLHQTKLQVEITRKRLNLKNHEEKESLIKDSALEIQAITEFYEKKLEDTNKQTELIVLSFQNEQKRIAELHEIYKVESTNNQAKIQIINLNYENQIENLKDKVDQLTQDLRKSDIFLAHKDKEIMKQKHNFDSKLKSIQKKFESQKENMMEENNQKIKEILKKELLNCQKYQKSVQKIQQKRNSEVKMFQNTLQDVKFLVDERPSKDEDVDKIKYLKMKINEKDRETRFALEHAKEIRLELNNRQETYNKIFTNSPVFESDKKRPKRQMASSCNKELSKFNSTPSPGTLGSFQKLEGLRNNNFPRTVKLF